MWQAIPGYENLYEASDDGEIRTAYQKITTNKRFSKRVWKQRVLKQSERKRHKGKETSDYMVTLWKDNKPHKHLVSRLIATTFCGDYLKTNLTVNHKDGNPHNNRADNLEWVTRAENIQLGFKNGQYLNNCRCIDLLSESGIVLSYISFAETDRFLKQYKGYTSRAISKHQSALKSRSGKTYYIKGETT